MSGNYVPGYPPLEAEPTTKQHDGFKTRLWQSPGALFAVADWVHRSERDMLIYGLRVAPTAREFSQFVDEGDIHILDLDGDRIVGRKVLQVKGCEFEFTCEKDWPYRDKDKFIVTSVAPLKRLEEELKLNVVAHIRVALDRQHIGVVYANSRPRWRKCIETMDNTGNPEEIWRCPLECVRWFNMLDHPLPKLKKGTTQ